MQEGFSTPNEPAVDGNFSADKSEFEPEKNFFKKHKTKLLVGGIAVGFAISIPQINETAESIQENAEWAVPALITTEALWNIGAIVMLGSAGQKIKNPLEIKSRLKEAKNELKDSKVFRAGLATNLVGATGTSVIIAAGSVAELPKSTWPSAFLVSGLSLAPSVAIARGVYKDQPIEAEEKG